ncbi:MAG: ketoacyl-ACP synthase III [Vicinamibacteria bacterium]|nr:ketoacyl-ACP synthase III [Vicinamibacteria bacterium]
MSKTRARITSLGRYVPPRVVTNAELEKLVNTNDEWIRTRTGIRQRHYAEPGTPTSEIALHACRDALAKRGLGADEIDLIIVATVTPDMTFPATACLLQEKLGASKAWGFDVSAACSGFLYALTTGAQFIENGVHKKVLVVGADVMTSILDFQDRATCVLFGDGGGAVLLEPGNDGTGVLDFSHEVDGTGAQFLYMEAGGSRRPASHETIDKRLHYVHQEGGQVFKFAVRKMAEVSLKVLEKNGLTGADVDLFVAHQANIRIIDAAQQRLGLPDDKVIKNIDRYGNTTAGTIPLALGTALDEGRLKAGDTLVLASVGAGFTVGGVLLKWSGVNWG